MVPLVIDNNFVGMIMSRQSSAAKPVKECEFGAKFPVRHDMISRLPRRAHALSLLMEKRLQHVRRVTTGVSLQAEVRGVEVAGSVSLHNGNVMEQHLECRLNAFRLSQGALKGVSVYKCGTKRRRGIFFFFRALKS